MRNNPFFSIHPCSRFTNFALTMANRIFFLLFLLAVGLFSCLDNEALRGRITLALTDAPTDASNIREVNIAISGIEVLKKGTQTWQTIKSFEEPLTLNLLEFTQGEFYDLTEQYLTPGEYEGLRLELNVANVDNGLTVFPQSNLVFTNGSQETLFVEDGGTNYVEVRHAFEIRTNETTFLTLDFDVRKSIILTGLEYRLRPVMRMVSTLNAGGIDGQFRDFANYSKVVVYAYAPGTFTNSEQSQEVPFVNAISSALVRNSVGGRFFISFLPEGSYDLVFVKLTDTGSVSSVLGKLTGTIVVGKENTFVCAQLTTPTVQGNCVQIEPIQ